MTRAPTMTAAVDLVSIAQRLDTIAAQVAYLAERQQAQEELFTELTPVARAALDEAITRLDALDRKGAFALAQEVTTIAREVLDGLGTAAERAKPVGVFGALRASKDHDVQKGLAIALEVLRRIGKAAEHAPARPALPAADRKEKLAALLGPRRTARPLLPAPAPACATPRAGAAPIGPWSRELGDALAGAEGITLTPQHWAVIEAARADYAQTQASPNIRRLTQIANLATKDLYALFPKAPGRTIAKIAGLPKPAGCL